MGTEVYHHLKGIIRKKYGANGVNVGDEGGFAPNIADTKEGLDLLVDAIAAAGYTGKVKLGMDVAASEFWCKETKSYNPYYKVPGHEDTKLTGLQMCDLYEELVANYPIVSIEDPFDQDDWESYVILNERMGKNVS